MVREAGLAEPNRKQVNNIFGAVNRSLKRHVGGLARWRERRTVADCGIAVLIEMVNVPLAEEQGIILC